MKRRRVEYALVYPNGKPATIGHQDDSETPLVSRSLEGLVGDIADWADTDNGYILKGLNLQTGELLLDNHEGEPEKFLIVRREVRIVDLPADDLAELVRIKQEDDRQEAEFNARYGG